MARRYLQRASAAVAGICDFANGRTPLGEVGSTITMVSVEPSGHTTWKVLPAGSTFQVVWPDGSTETMVIVDPTSPNGVRPLAKSQIPATAADAR